MEEDINLTDDLTNGDLMSLDPRVVLQNAWFTDHAIERMLERHSDARNCKDPESMARKLLLAAKEEPAKDQIEQAKRIRAIMNNGFNQTRFFSNSGYVFVISWRKRKKRRSGSKKRLSVVTVL